MTGAAQPLPCPFCRTGNIAIRDTPPHVMCGGCFAQGPLSMGEGADGGIAMWNRRDGCVDRPEGRDRRIEELLEANNRYLARARAAEAQLAHPFVQGALAIIAAATTR